MEELTQMVKKLFEVVTRNEQRREPSTQESSCSQQHSEAQAEQRINIDTRVSKDKHSLPIFNGEGKEDFHDWVKDVELKRNLLQWSEQETMTHVFSRLQGRPLRVIHNYVGDELATLTWESFKARTKLIFPTEESNIAYVSKAIHYKQGSKQTAKEYLQEKMELLSKYNPKMDKVSMLGYLKEGLLPKVQKSLERVLGEEHQNIEKFNAEVIKIDQIERRWDEQRSRAPQNRTSEITEHKQTESAGNKFRESRIKFRRTCNYCRQEGHLWKDCLKRKTWKPRSEPVNKASNTVANAISNEVANTVSNTVENSFVNSTTSERRGIVFYADVTVNGCKNQALIDSGCSIGCIITEEFAKKIGASVTGRDDVVSLADGSTSKACGVCELTIEIDGDVYPLKGVHVWKSCMAEIILGTGFLNKFFVINLVDACMYKKDNIIIFQRTPSAMIKLSRRQLIEEFASGVTSKHKESFDICNTLSETERTQVRTMLEDYRDRFAASNNELGSAELNPFKITLRHEEPITTGLRRIRPHLKEKVEAEIESMLKCGVIRRSTSPYASAIVPVMKPDNSVRICIDYKPLNAATIPDAYPMKIMDEILQDFRGGRYFVTLDLLSGYWQVPMHKDSVKYTAFTSHLGLFEFLRMPFGLRNAPAWFQREMDAIFCSELGVRQSNAKFRIYLDDIIIWGADIRELLEGVKNVMKILRKYNLKIKYAKCHFAYKEITYLGHKVSYEGVQPLQDKSRLIYQLQRTPPTTLKQLRRFLGMTSFYRNFVKNYSNIAMPLYLLLKKSKKFVWTKVEDDAYQTLCCAFSSLPITAHYNPNTQIVLETDASDFAIAGILKQPDDSGVLRTVLYYGRLLRSNELNYTTTEKECLAIVVMIKKFKHLIGTQPVLALTDHHPLCYLLASTEPSSQRIQRWLLECQDVNLTIMHSSGSNNHLADVLSRNPFENLIPESQSDYEPEEAAHDFVVLCAANCDTNETIEENVEALDDTTNKDEEEVGQESKEIGPVIDEILVTQDFMGHQDTDLFCKELKKELEKGVKISEFVMIKGLLCRRTNIDDKYFDRPVVPYKLRETLVREVHETPLIGHPGQVRLQKLLCNRVWWPHMRATINEIVRRCETCQIRKLNSNLKYGKLVPLAVQLSSELDSTFAALGMDIIVLKDHPTKRNNKYILSVIDFLS